MAAEGGPVAIAVAPNGGWKTRSDHPALPLTGPELAATAAECLDAGAAMIHIHVRDADGRHLLDADAYADTIAAIRRKVGDALLIQITSESLGLYSPDEQISVIRQVEPEAVSLALRELVPDEAHEAAFSGLLSWLRARAVIPQIILYDAAEAARLDAMFDRGLIPFETIPVLFAPGRYTGSPASRPDDILPFLAAPTPRLRHWTACAFGGRERACVIAAALLGGHVRVGFENNLWLPDGRLAASNADLVRGVAETLSGLGIPLQDGVRLRSELRALLNLNG